MIRNIVTRTQLRRLYHHWPTPCDVPEHADKCVIDTKNKVIPDGGEKSKLDPSFFKKSEKCTIDKKNVPDTKADS